MADVNDSNKERMLEQQQEQQQQKQPEEVATTSLTGWLPSWTAIVQEFGPSASASASEASGSASPRNYGSVPFESNGFNKEDHDDKEKAASESEAFPPSKLDIEEAMELLGMGPFQYKILVAAVRRLDF
jgi:hypothetical protein